MSIADYEILFVLLSNQISSFIMGRNFGSVQRVKAGLDEYEDHEVSIGNLRNVSSLRLVVW
jgi:hypothetical protein